MTETRECLECGKSFKRPELASKKDWERKYKCCSLPCARSYRHKEFLARPIEQKECAYCHKIFPKPYGYGAKLWQTRRYCSHSCETRDRRLWEGRTFEKGNIPWNKGTTGLMPTPWNKGKHLPICNLGEENWNWIGRSNSRDRLENTFLMKNWKSEIRERDGNACTFCGKTEVVLDVHHKKPLRQLIKEAGTEDYEKLLAYAPLWDLTNGVTLCNSCHSKLEPRRKKV